MDWDGSGQTRLTNTFEISEGQPAWSPDGRRLLYRQTQDNPIVQNADIWQIDVDPAAPNPRPVLQRTGDERHRSFSPDGTRIVFESARDSGDARRPDVYVMDADGSDVRRLTADPAHDEARSGRPTAGRSCSPPTAPAGRRSTAWTPAGAACAASPTTPRARSRPTGSRSRSTPPARAPGGPAVQGAGAHVRPRARDVPRRSHEGYRVRVARPRSRAARRLTRGRAAGRSLTGISQARSLSSDAHVRD
jgi:hypothetical protein